MSGGTFSKADSTNPKDLRAENKVSLTKLPIVGVVHGAHAMMNGADKYGPYNWRSKRVIASIYIDAAMRHLGAWFEGQESASDSGVHHLGHVIACASILLDAQETGNLVDDRPVPEKSDAKLKEQALMENLLDRLSLVISGRRAELKDLQPPPAASQPQRGPSLPPTSAGSDTTAYTAESLRPWGPPES